MADLAKTSRICVIFDLFLVVIIAVFSPVSESVAEAGGLLPVLSQSVFRPRTCFVGLGIMSFAFSCQHSSLIIAGSLKNPSRDRWNRVSLLAMGACCTLGIVMGSFGYLGFLESTEGGKMWLRRVIRTNSFHLIQTLVSMVKTSSTIF